MKKDKSIKIRLSENEYEELRSKCERRNIGMSKYIREKCFQSGNSDTIFSSEFKTALEMINSGVIRLNSLDLINSNTQDELISIKKLNTEAIEEITKGVRELWLCLK